LAWTLRFETEALQQIKKLDRQWQKRVVDYLTDEVAPLGNPRSKGHGLMGDLAGLWRYRVGDFRVLCEIRDTELLILIIAVGHRSSVYR